MVFREAGATLASSSLPSEYAGGHSGAPGVAPVFIASPVAQMTTTFEKVKEMSNAYRLFQKVHLIEEFKQYHDTP